MKTDWETHKAKVLAEGGMAMGHDELVALLGDKYNIILDAGFVLVPKKWRDEIFELLRKRTIHSWEI